MMNIFHKQKTIGSVAVIGGVVLGFVGGLLVERAYVYSHVAPLGIVSATGTGRVLGIGQLPPADLANKDVEFKQFWELWSLLKEKYYQQPVQDKQMFYGAMSGLASSLGDPYTTYFQPTDAEDFQQALSGKFEGIGAEIGIKDDQLQIVAPLPDSPASRAGILAGDFIVKIDGTETTGMSVEKAVSLIRGPKDTKVTLTIFRPTAKKPPIDITITRDQIQIKSVMWKMLPGKIAQITVTHFNGDTEDGFNAAADAVMRQSPKGIILDLRNNPGGFLATALSMAGEWVGNATVVKERRQGKIFDELKGAGKDRFDGIPTVVLVNQGSASASEIVAGALQDYGKATLVGMKTFGKGSVQDYQSLPDGSGVKITIAEWLTPKERQINKLGLEPDIRINQTQEDYDAKRDPQLDRAVGILNGTATTTSIGADAPAVATSTRP